MSGKKPLEEFIDPRVRDDVIIEDFVLILKIAVLCVASSSVGRPTIKDVFEEMDKALRNTTIKVQILSSIAHSFKLVCGGSILLTNVYILFILITNQFTNSMNFLWKQHCSK